MSSRGTGEPSTTWPPRRCISTASMRPRRTPSALCRGLRDRAGAVSADPVLDRVIRTARGRLAEGAEILDTTVEIARVSSHAQGLAWNLGSRSLAATAAGDVEAALRAARGGHRGAGRFGAELPGAWAAVSLAAALEQAGDPGAPPRCCSRLAGGDDLPRIPGVWRPAGFELTDALPARARRPRRGARAPPTVQRRARGTRPSPRRRPGRPCARHGGAGWRRPARRCRASAGVGDHRREAARPWRRPCRACSPDARSPQAGERKRAATELDGAAAASTPARRRAAARPPSASSASSAAVVYRRTRPGKSDGTGVESLTERELEVARLVVDRKTNAQIASELFPEPEDGGDAHPPPLPQARRVVAGRGRARGRACRPPGRRAVAGGSPRSGRRGQIRVPDQGVVPMSGARASGKLATTENRRERD